MTSPVGGIDPRQDTFTVGIVDPNGVEVTHDTFANTAAVDAVASARVLLAEPTLGPVQALEAYNPLVAEIEAVLEHRRALVAVRTLGLHHVGDQIAKLPTEIRDQLSTEGKIESRLRRLEQIDPAACSAPSGRYRLERLQAFIDQDRAARSDIGRLERRIEGLLDAHGTTPRDEPGIGPIAPATLLCEVGDPHRLGRETRVRPLARHRRGRPVLRRGQRRPDQAPARLQRQPTRQLSAAHRITHPSPPTARRHRLPRPNSIRRQNPG